MFFGIIEFDRASELRSACDDVAGSQQGDAHDAMSHDERTSSSLLLGELQELLREFAHGIAIE
jgi:hypothetical protein